MTRKTIFSGFGGQGVLMMGYVLAIAGMRNGMHVTYLPSYGAEVRGGTANCTVVVSDEEIFSPVASFPDYAVIMNSPSLSRFEESLKKNGCLILNSNLVDKDPSRKDLTVIKVPANDIARELGSDRTINMIMLGAFVTATKISTPDAIMNGLNEIIKTKNAALMELNKKGLDKGIEYALKAL